MTKTNQTEKTESKTKKTGLKTHPASSRKKGTPTFPSHPPHRTIGLDLGDRSHTVCVLDETGKVLKEATLRNDREALDQLAAAFPKARVVMECGMHSPWISRHLQNQEMEVIVANPRKVRAISQHERKCDQRDAQLLARLGRVDPQLLAPIQHGTAQAQLDFLQIKLRDALVRSRVDLINALRFTLKSLGHSVTSPASERFHKTVIKEVPAECLPLLQPALAVVEQITQQIKTLEKAVVEKIKQSYPQAQRLQQITGVGPITSLSFVLKIESPDRFPHVRDVGAYLGLCPRRDQSGGTDKQLGITKCGDSYLRRLLVQAAQYILGPFGPETALRTFGQKLAGTGNGRDKKKAVIAVARKLAVLMLSLWKNGADYQPLGQPQPA